MLNYVRCACRDSRMSKTWGAATLPGSTMLSPSTTKSKHHQAQAQAQARPSPPTYPTAASKQNKMLAC